VRISDNRYEWRAGRKADGTFVRPGRCTFHFQPVDWWVAHKYFHVNLFCLDIKPKIPVKLTPLPNQPFHYRLDPSQLGLELEGLEYVEVDLLRGKEVVARLGRFGPSASPAGSIHVVLQKGPSRSLGKQGFELRVRAANGKVLLRQAIPVEIVK
jgi:hypothetical protein